MYIGNNYSEIDLVLRPTLEVQKQRTVKFRQIPKQLPGFLGGLGQDYVYKGYLIELPETEFEERLRLERERALEIEAREVPKKKTAFLPLLITGALTLI